MSASVSLSVSVIIIVLVSFSVCLYMSLRFIFSDFVFISSLVSVSVSPSLPFCLCFCFCFCLPLRLCLSLCSWRLVWGGGGHVAPTCHSPSGPQFLCLYLRLLFACYHCDTDCSPTARSSVDYRQNLSHARDTGEAPAGETRDTQRRSVTSRRQAPAAAASASCTRGYRSI